MKSTEGYEYTNKLDFAGERRLLEECRMGSSAAKEYLIRAHVLLVHGIARRYVRKCGTILDLSDLIQEGVVGLFEAAEKFDVEKNHRFSTYATFWIRRAIVRAIENFGRTIRIPAKTLSRNATIAAAARSFEERYGKRPSVNDLADATGLTEGEVKFALELPKCSIALDAPIRREEGYGERIIDRIADGKPPHDELLISREQHQQIAEGLASLRTDRRVLIEKRYGLNGYEIQSARELAAELGLKKGAVEQRLRKIKRQLREQFGVTGRPR